MNPYSFMPNNSQNSLPDFLSIFLELNVQSPLLRAVQKIPFLKTESSFSDLGAWLPVKELFEVLI